MPTGYTHHIASGQVTDLATFAMQCARAFGALIMMRDEPSDAPIPERFEPRSAYRAQVDSLARQLEKLRNMSPSEAQAACQQDHTKAVAAWRDRCDERGLQRARYLAMRSKVEAWQPPTEEHQGLKKFMLEQIDQSVEWDCHTWSSEQMPSLERWPDWLKRNIHNTEQLLHRFMHSDAEEIGRTVTRNVWVRQLRNSLNNT